MSAKANPARIGLFVVGAVVLLVASVIVFGSGAFFRQADTYVTYFEGSLSGLRVGAPVTFRGIPIGSVTDVRVEMFPQEMQSRIPVYFNVFPEEFTVMGEVTGTREERLQALIEAGLRAQLVSQSLVTGQLAIEISMHPEAPARRVGADPSVIEIPSVPSTVQQLMGELRQLQLNQLVNSAGRLIDDVDALVSTPEARQLMPALLQLSEDARRLVDTLDSEVGLTGEHLRSTADAATAVFDRGDRTLETIEPQVVQALQDLRILAETLETAVPGLLARLDTTLDSIDASIQPDAAVIRDLRNALQQAANAARSVRELADAIERNPGILLRGR